MKLGEDDHGGLTYFDGDRLCGNAPTVPGWCVDVAAHNAEVHHVAPRCLLKLRDEAEGELRLAGVGAWMEFEHECQRWGVPVEIAREDLERLVEASTEVMERERHRLLHASDWQRGGPDRPIKS